MDLATVLQNAQHPNHEIRTQAEAQLNSAVEEQYGPFLLALCGELATESRPETSRQLAGLYMKNMITAQDEAIVEVKRQKWLQCDPATKDQIRAGFLEAIKSPVQVVSHTSAQILAAYGAVDVPKNAWPNLLATLFNYISTPEIPDGCKVASLEALGYMCELMNPDEVEVTIVNQILSSIVDGMRADRADSIRLAAVIALNNSLEFTHANFENSVERDAIIRAVCEASQAQSDSQIRARAFECFATIGELYYDKLQPYVETMFNLSVNALRSDKEEVGMQVLELWNTISDTEISIKQDVEDGEGNGEQFLNLTGTASPTLVPMLLEHMTKQEEDEEGGENWNIATASATLLEGIARTIEDGIVDMVLPFVTQNINNTNWHLKEAAVMAFGTILDGPSSDKLSPLVMQAMPILINCLKDPNTLVRNTSAWTIGRICEMHKNALTNDVIPAMVAGLAAALEDPAPKVVGMACYGVHSLAEACEDESEAASNLLSHFMPMMLQKLFTVTVREDWDTENLRANAYEAVNAMVANSALDMQPIVVQLLSEVLNRLEASFNPQIEAQERMNLQSCLCSLVAEIGRKLESVHIVPLSDRIMTLLFKVFETKGAVAQEDAFMAIGVMAEKIGDQFIRYMQHLQPILIGGLKSIEEFQLCTVAVGVVGDLCRALNRQILPYCDDIVRCLLELLQSQVLNRSVKPHVISLFSDIALAIEGDFDRYAIIILGILKQAGEVNITTDDEELVEYINTLRNSILEAYTGIVQGLTGANKQEMVLPFVEPIVEFLSRSANDSNRSGEVLKSAVGLLGDLGQSFGAKVAQIYRLPVVGAIFHQASQDEQDTKEVALWAKQIVDNIIKSS